MVRRMLLAAIVDIWNKLAMAWMTYIGRVELCSAEESPFVEHIFVHALMPLFPIRFALVHLPFRTPFPLNSYTALAQAVLIFPLPPS